MTDLDRIAHRVASCAIQVKYDEDHLGRQSVRELVGLGNSAKQAYRARRKARIELDAATQEYMDALTALGQLPESGGSDSERKRC